MVFSFVMSVSAATDALSRLMAQPYNDMSRTAAHHNHMQDRVPIHFEERIVVEFMANISKTSGRNAGRPNKGILRFKSARALTRLNS